MRVTILLQELIDLNAFKRGKKALAWACNGYLSLQTALLMGGLRKSRSSETVGSL